jgi:hypothetical protein
MNDKLYIPERINVGYQLREDTYTGKLAYVIYWDSKGKLRKETGWNSWRNRPEDVQSGEYDYKTRTYSNETLYGDQVKAQEFVNEPTEGFVLNKGVGGQRQSWGWNARNEYIRVYDPRDFEFEISVANLLFILQESNSIKGKGLEGKFVYSWEGKELVLLPAESFEHQTSSRHTNLQSKKVTRKDMLAGCQYVSKDGSELVYLGRHDYMSHDRNRYSYYNSGVNKVKGHVFYDLGAEEDECQYQFHKGFTKLAEKVTTEAAGNYADILEEFLESKYGCLVKDVQYKKVDLDWSELMTKKDSHGWKEYPEKELFIVNGAKVALSTLNYSDAKDSYYHKANSRTKNPHFEVSRNYVISFKDGSIVKNYANREDTYYTPDEAFSAVEAYDMNIILESGKEITYNEYFND